MNIYIYTDNKEILSIKNAELIDTEKMETIQSIYKDDIRNAFGKIVINEETFEPEYKDNYMTIMVEKNTNNFTRVDNPRPEDNDYYFATVTVKDFTRAKSIDTTKYVSKYFNNSFYTLEIIRDSNYNPTTNDWDLDLEKYRSTIIEKLKNSEDEIRQHGFPHSLYGGGKKWLQPFRTVQNDNDQTVLLNLKLTIPLPLRRLKAWVEDDDGRRVTESRKYYWLKPGCVTDTVLDSLLMLMTGYSEYLRTGLYQLIATTAQETNLERLKDIDKKYVQIVLNNLRNVIENQPVNKKLLDDQKKKLQAEGIDVILDNANELGV